MLDQGPRQLQGALTEGDVRILDNQYTDPYSFEATSSGTATAVLGAIGFSAILRAHNGSGDMMAEATTDASGVAQVEFAVEQGSVYNILVIGADSRATGSYRLQYMPNLVFQSQIR